MSSKFFIIVIALRRTLSVGLPGETDFRLPAWILRSSTARNAEQYIAAHKYGKPYFCNARKKALNPLSNAVVVLDLV
jgi:hypothetical protein